jgi:RNA polymerase subunit RPABC4/transcription elongation factor Spt4
MDGSIFTVAARVHACPQCHRITWQIDVCLLCQKGATTRA